MARANDGYGHWGNNGPYDGYVDPRVDRSALDRWLAEQRAAAKAVREARKVKESMS